MDDNTANGQPEDPKKPYTKPQIQEVPLRPDEAVLGACKTAAVSGPAQHRCSTSGGCSSLSS